MALVVKVFVLVVILISGCSYSVKGGGYDRITGKTYLTQVDTVLFNYKCSSWGGKLMLRSGDFSGACKGDDVKFVPKYTMITVVDIVKISSLGFTCWRVVVKIHGIEESSLVDIPSCSLHHPKPSWIVTSNPFDDRFLEFKSDKLREFGVKSSGSPISQ